MNLHLHQPVYGGIGKLAESDGSQSCLKQIIPSSYRCNHGNTMPEKLVRRMLLVSCPENGLVLDPFGGARTTALVALQLGHRAISIEINPAYTKEARQRIAAGLGGLDDGSLAVAAE